MNRPRKETRERELHRKMLDLWQRGQSELCEVRGSVIHGQGVYATSGIAKGARIIEYVGEKIGKAESERRCNEQLESSAKSGGAAVYVFTLDDRYDIDGNVPWNTARLINHSCEPNCEAWIEESRIFLYASRDIAAGEELTFDYGFDIECYLDHPCRCGSKGCMGYIVSRDQWPELLELLGKSNPDAG